jgi:hypothetical protein
VSKERKEDMVMIKRALALLLEPPIFAMQAAIEGHKGDAPALTEQGRKDQQEARRNLQDRLSVALSTHQYLVRVP